MSRAPARLLALLLVTTVALGLGGGCGKSKKAAPKTTTTSSTTAPPGPGLAGVPAVGGAMTGTTGPGGCLGTPGDDAAKVEPHPDFPPLPEGTRWLERSVPQPGQTIAVAAVPETLPEIQNRIRTVWFPGGWRELAGESEPGREVEGVFQRQDVRIGMRARVLYCDKEWVEFRIVVNR